MWNKKENRSSFVQKSRGIQREANTQLHETNFKLKTSPLKLRIKSVYTDFFVACCTKSVMLRTKIKI